MKTILLISGLVLIVLAAIFSIRGVCRSKKLRTLGKVIWIIVLFLVYYSLLMVPIVLWIAKIRGVIH
jgi:hypothetical protein